MKKILILVPGYSSFKNPLTRTFTRSKWKVKTFDYRRGDLPIRILRFVPLIGGSDKAQIAIEKKIMSINNSFSPDVILTIKGESLSKALIKKIKNRNNKIINWFPDPMNLWSLILKIAPYYDFFCHFDPLVVRKLKKLGFKNAFYLPLAADIQEKRQQKKAYDLSFIGTYSEFREKRLGPLQKYDLNIWGDPRWQKSSLKIYARGGRIHQNTMKDIIARSKINLNIHFNAPKEGANLRTMEVTGCGGFLLTDYVKDIENLFSPNHEAVIYKTDQDLANKVSFYLKNRKLRNKIALAGFKRAKKSHEYSKRIKQMLKIARIN